MRCSQHAVGNNTQNVLLMVIGVAWWVWRSARRCVCCIRPTCVYDWQQVSVTEGRSASLFFSSSLHWWLCTCPSSSCWPITTRKWWRRILWAFCRPPTLQSRSPRSGLCCACVWSATPIWISTSLNCSSSSSFKSLCTSPAHGGLQCALYSTHPIVQCVYIKKLERRGIPVNPRWLTYTHTQSTPVFDVHEMEPFLFTPAACSSGVYVKVKPPPCLPVLCAVHCLAVNFSTQSTSYEFKYHLTYPIKPVVCRIAMHVHRGVA